LGVSETEVYLPNGKFNWQNHDNHQHAGIFKETLIAFIGQNFAGNKQHGVG